jgi:hypothetical protein
MSVSGISGSPVSSSGTSAASYLSSPAVQLAHLEGSALSTLFAPTTGEPSDLASFTATAVAMPLYQHAGLLSGLTQWDGSTTPGSQRAAATPAPAATPAAPQFSFNPFDQSSWDVTTTGSTVDTTA